jgi:hypothetical protein
MVRTMRNAFRNFALALIATLCTVTAVEAQGLCPTATTTIPDVGRLLTQSEMTNNLLNVRAMCQNNLFIPATGTHDSGGDWMFRNAGHNRDFFMDTGGIGFEGDSGNTGLFIGSDGLSQWWSLGQGTAPACGTGAFWIVPSSTSNTWKICQDGVLGSILATTTGNHPLADAWRIESPNTNQFFHIGDDVVEMVGGGGYSGFEVNNDHRTDWYSDGAGTVPACNASEYFIQPSSTSHTWKICQNGTLGDISLGGGGGSGTVTSVGATVPAWLSVSGSPVTTSGTLAISANTQSANTVLAGPTSGSAAAPTFRALDVRDRPSQVAGFYRVDDFLENLVLETANTPAGWTGRNLGELALSFITNGTGTSNSNSQLTGGDTNPGIIQASTGTVATNIAGAIGTGNDVDFGAGEWRLEAIFRIPVLGTSSQRFTTRVGFIDSANATESTDAAMVRYADNVNGGNFQCVTRSNNTETATDSGVAAVAATWYKVIITVNAAGTSVDCNINGTTVTNSTNIPVGTSRFTGWGMTIVKSVGTTASLFDMDFLGVRFSATTPR